MKRRLYQLRATLRMARCRLLHGWRETYLDANGQLWADLMCSVCGAAHGCPSLVRKLQ